MTYIEFAEKIIDVYRSRHIISRNDFEDEVKDLIVKINKEQKGV